MELPSASSLVRQRAGGPEPRRRWKAVLVVAAAAFLALGVGISLLYSSSSKPRLTALEPSIGDPGSVVSLKGENLGKERGDSQVEVDGVYPTSSSYISWSDDGITVRLPASVDSGLVRVVTARGRSNALLFMNRARLPVPAGGTKEGRAGPFIASLSADSGLIGSLLVLKGLDFGASRGGAAVFFAWSSEDEGSPASGDQAAPRTVRPPEEDLAYELWSDKEIRLRVPDGAVSGPVYVETSRGRSNVLFFRVAEGPGAKRYSSGSVYALSSGVSVTKVRASGRNDLYLWAPLPVSSSSQRLVRVLEQDPQPVVPDYRGTALFHFADLATGKSLSVEQSFLVQSYAVEASVDARALALPPRDVPPQAAAFLAADELAPADAPEIQAALKKAAGSERGSWKAARLVMGWLAKNLTWTDRPQSGRPIDSLKSGRADSYSYAIVACALLRKAGVPALPVAGCLIDQSRKAVRHYWLEAYIYGLGWVPIDPVLASGAEPGGVRPAWEDRSRYLSGVDGRRVAFSRGLTVLAPMASGGRRAAKDRRWSFQSFYEEASGALDAYSSFWGDIEVTGMY